jgi:predicted NAD/FAD-dependent oxidoreductase
MVILDKSLPIPVDAIQIDHASNPTTMKSKFGTLAWITRDSSKPGRRHNNNDNGKTNECWVLQSSEEEGKCLLESKGLGGASLEYIREVIRETMVADFKKSLPLLMSSTNTGSNDSTKDIPTIVQSIGHRWGAAFPKHIAEENAFKSMDCYLDADKHFIACGDYFGKYHGSVEGAYLSGRAAANQLMKQVELLNFGFRI